MERRDVAQARRSPGLGEELQEIDGEVVELGAARRAAEMGLVNHVVDEGKALEAALELAEKIAANGPLALIATKEISNSGGDWTAEERWD